MKVAEIIENALYLSVKDRYFDRIPEATKEAYLIDHVRDLNRVLVGIDKKNPGVFHTSTPNGSLLRDTDLNMSYVDLSTSPFSTIFRVEFLYSGGSSSISLTRLGMNDFFGQSDIRTINTFPAWYNYNTFSNKMYIYPTPSVGGTINIFGKRKLGPFPESLEGLNEGFPDEVSDTFLLFLEYYLGRYLCSKYNAPWQAQKEELLKDYKAAVDSENNTAYQMQSLEGSKFALPVRNTRLGL